MLASLFLRWFKDNTSNSLWLSIFNLTIPTIAMIPMLINERDYNIYGGYTIPLIVGSMYSVLLILNYLEKSQDEKPKIKRKVYKLICFLKRHKTMITKGFLITLIFALSFELICIIGKTNNNKLGNFKNGIVVIGKYLMTPKNNQHFEPQKKDEDQIISSFLKQTNFLIEQLQKAPIKINSDVTLTSIKINKKHITYDYKLSDTKASMVKLDVVPHGLELFLFCHDESIKYLNQNGFSFAYNQYNNGEKIYTKSIAQGECQTLQNPVTHEDIPHTITKTETWTNEHTTIKAEIWDTGHVKLTGDTMWGLNRKYGPSTGDMEGFVDIEEYNNTQFSIGTPKNECYVSFTRINAQTMHLDDNYMCGGINARFIGEVKLTETKP